MCVRARSLSFSLSLSLSQGRELSVMTPEFEEGRKRYDEFEELYKTFIAEVIAPGLGGGRVQYQVCA